MLTDDKQPCTDVQSKEIRDYTCGGGLAALAAPAEPAEPRPWRIMRSAVRSIMRSTKVYDETRQVRMLYEQPRISNIKRKSREHADNHCNGSIMHVY